MFFYQPSDCFILKLFVISFDVPNYHSWIFSPEYHKNESVKPMTDVNGLYRFYDVTSRPPLSGFSSFMNEKQQFVFPVCGMHGPSIVQQQSRYEKPLKRSGSDKKRRCLGFIHAAAFLCFQKYSRTSGFTCSDSSVSHLKIINTTVPVFHSL